MEGHTSIAELLLRKGALIEAKNGDNETPLDLALKYRRTDIVKLFNDQAAKRAAHGGRA